jgi:phosphoribosylanthranilate isomerase
MTLVKICGITNAEDAAFCDTQGADFLGFIFVNASPRRVRAEEVAEIKTRAMRVGVFRDTAVDEIAHVAKIARLDFVQLHGSESDEVIGKITLPVIKAFCLGQAGLPVLHLQTKAEWVMFDSGGGTGRVFDWKLIDGYREKPFFLAGGITPDNVSEAIRIVKPDAIDVASGVERAPGVKDHAKVRALFERIRA